MGRARRALPHRLVLAGLGRQGLVLWPLPLQRGPSAAVALPARQWRAHHRRAAPAACRVPRRQAGPDLGRRPVSSRKGGAGRRRRAWHRTGAAARIQPRFDAGRGAVALAARGRHLPSLPRHRRGPDPACRRVRGAHQPGPVHDRRPPLGQAWDRREIGGATAVGYFRARSLTEGGYVAWVLRLVEIGAEGEGSCADVVEISRPDGLVDIADLGLTLAEAKLVLAGVQREIVAAQARDHAVRRPGCRRCEGVCRVTDYRQHAIATLFGQVAVRLPRFCCAGCGTTGTGVEWPPYARSTPELDRLRAQLSALLTYRTAAALLGQMFPVAAGQDPETLRRHIFKIAKTLAMMSAAEAPVSVDAQAIVVTLDSTFIRSCEDGERHLEVRIGNIETEFDGRQVFGVVAKANTDIGALIRRALDA